MRSIQFIWIVVLTAGIATAIGSGADTQMEKDLAALLTCSGLVAGTAIAAVADGQIYQSKKYK